MKVFRIIRI